MDQSAKDKTMQDLFNFYNAENRQDFYIAYMYLKHIREFMGQVGATLGLPTAPTERESQPSVDEMLRAYVLQIGENAISRDTNIYHGKVMKIEDAKKLVTLNEPIHIETPEQVVPFKIAKDIIMENPQAISVGRCPCRAANPSPCIPPEEQEVCLIMGNPFAAFIAEHNPDYRHCTQEEALSIIEKAHERGDVHTAYFKKELGNRMMAICNCCGCCCTGMVMWKKLNGAIPILASSGYVARVTEDCTACGLCAENTCPFEAISMNEDESMAAINYDKCMGCGVCADRCPSQAISLERDPSKGDPLDIDVLK